MAGEGKRVKHRCVVTIEEAALQFARTPEARAEAALPPPMTAAEAVAQAEAEGLTLARSNNKSGFRNVDLNHHSVSHRRRPYQAQVWRGGKYVHLGSFVTAE